jgi:hypothetical protein
MALSKKVETPQGFVADSAYISIGHIETLNKTSMSFSLDFRKEKELDAFVTKSFKCNFDVRGDNPYRQAYLHLKTLPEFSDSVDC